MDSKAIRQEAIENQLLFLFQSPPNEQHLVKTCKFKIMKAKGEL